MKKTVLAAVLTFFTLLTYAAAPAGWFTDLAKAQAEAQKTRKPLFVLVTGSSWCPPCKALEKSVISKRAFQKTVAKNAIGVFLDIPRSGMSRATRASVQKLTFFRGGVPAYAVLDPELNILKIPEERSIKDFNAAIKEGASKVKKQK